MNSQGNLVLHSSLENHIAIKRFKSPHQYFLLLNQHCRVKYEIYNQTVASKKKDTEVTVIQKKGERKREEPTEEEMTVNWSSEIWQEFSNNKKVFKTQSFKLLNKKLLVTTLRWNSRITVISLCETLSIFFFFSNFIFFKCNTLGTRIYEDLVFLIENQICKISLFTTITPNNLAIQTASSFIIHRNSIIFWWSKPEILIERIIKVEISPLIFFDFVSTPRSKCQTLLLQSITSTTKHRSWEN